MQLKTLQVAWHDKEPVFSVDFQPSSHTVVTGGQDGELKVQRVQGDGVACFSQLSRCERSAVRLGGARLPRLRQL